MTNRQDQKNKMYKRLLVFFAVPAYVAIWAGYTRLVAEIANFVSKNTPLNNAIDAQARLIAGLTQASLNAFHTMIETVISRAHKAYPWAVDTNNADLEAVLDVEESDFDGKESEAYKKAKKIRDGISDNIGALAGYDLNGTDVTAMNDSITAYENTIQASQAAEGAKEAGTIAIGNAMKPLDKSVKLIMKMLAGQYGNTQTDMVNEFIIDKEIGKGTIRHNELDVHGTDINGDDIENFKVELEGTDYVAYSDINGLAHFPKLKLDTYWMVVTMATYVTIRVKVKIQRGKTVVMAVQLHKV